MREAKYRSWSPTYISWQRMHDRCYKKSNNRFRYYGERGIKVCKRWHVFENFLADMGERPEGLSLDRKNNNGNYHKRNCRWATRSEQMRNRSNNLKFRGKFVIDIAKTAGVDRETIKYRIRMGWKVSEIFNGKHS